MAMSEEEILREAARIRAGRRARVAKNCERCGTSFIGVAQAKYCSDACRMAAARERHIRHSPDPEHAFYIRVEPRLPGESDRKYFERTAGRPPTADEEETIAAMERIRDFWSRHPIPADEIEDSTEIIRREREARTKHLSSL